MDPLTVFVVYIIIGVCGPTLPPPQTDFQVQRQLQTYPACKQINDFFAYGRPK